MSTRVPMRALLLVATTIGVIAGASVPAVAAGITVTTTKLAVASDTPPAFYPTSLTLANGGANAGRAQTGDTVVTVYGAQVLQSTLCSGWTSNATATRSLTSVTFTLGNNTGATGNDTFTVTTVPATCSGGFKYGTVDLGSPNYVTSANATFTGSTIALSQTASSTTLTFTLGIKAGSGTIGTVTSGNAAVCTPTTTIANTSGTTILANAAQTTATAQW